MNILKEWEIIQDQTTASLNTKHVTWKWDKRNVENNGRKKFQERRLE
jgi:hypothetical protein